MLDFQLDFRSKNYIWSHYQTEYCRGILWSKGQCDVAKLRVIDPR